MPNKFTIASKSVTPENLLWTYSCEGAVISVSSTVNCSFIAIGSVDRKVSLISKQGQQVWDKELDNEVWAVDISDNGTWIAAGTARKNPPDGSIYVFNDKGTTVFKHEIGSPVWSVSFSDNARVLVVSSWNNQAYRFEKVGTTYKLKKKGQFGRNGLYGIVTSRDGKKSFLASYDTGIKQLSSSWLPIKGMRANLKTGLYNIALSGNQKSVVVGCRDGTFSLIRDIDNPSITTSSALSKRPICGVAIDWRSSLVAAGSFDGKVYISSLTGKCFWSYQTDGEVWSTAMSSDGQYICVASGDQQLYLFKNTCTSAVVEEIEGFEQFIMNLDTVGFKNEVVKFFALCSHYGLIEYGIRRTRNMAVTKMTDKEINKILYVFIKENLETHTDNFQLHKHLAYCAEKLGDYATATKHYQISSKDPLLYHSSMYSAGKNLDQLGLSSAAKSCYRRAIQQSLDTNSKNILYNLARSYEDVKDWSRARVIYEVLVSWDFNFRNAWMRLDKIQKKDNKAKTDYTGVTVNLLGVDAPKKVNVDESLEHILKGRAKELGIDHKSRMTLKSVLNELEGSYELPFALRNRDSLEYDEVAYMKYDYLPPEDEAKKQLEMLYELSILKKNKFINTALDIGSATGRHPMILADMGIRSVGVDIEQRAVQYAKKRKENLIGSYGYPFFCVGDGSKLPFIESYFNLVTCMMGTFAHLPHDCHKNFLEEVFRVLTVKGIFILSTWDKECEHLSLLTLYGEEEKTRIKKYSLTIHQLTILLERAGFKILEVIPFMMLPNVLTYELNLQSLELDDLRNMVEIDFSALSFFPSLHGEMFMIVCGKYIAK
jgi:SAM-dependent methyltransferase/outer membrane protein assembly factor BamB